VTIFFIDVFDLTSKYSLSCSRQFVNNLLADLDRCRGKGCACEACSKGNLDPIKAEHGEERCWRCDKVYCAACKGSPAMHGCMELKSVRVRPDGPNHPFCVWCCRDGFIELPGIDTLDAPAVGAQEMPKVPLVPAQAQAPVPVPVPGKGKEEADDDDHGHASSVKIPTSIDGRRLTKAERKAMKKAAKAMEVSAKLEKAKKRLNQVKMIDTPERGHTYLLTLFSIQGAR